MSAEGERSVFSSYWLRMRLEFYEMLLAHGFNVILLMYPFKTPRGLWGSYKSTRAPAEVIRRALSVPKKNFGIVTGRTSGFVIVDIEDLASKELLEQRLPATPLRVKTGKMEHWYYQIRPGQEVPRRIRVELDGHEIAVDQLGEGGYAVGPYSLHPAKHLMDEIEYEALSFDEKTAWAESCGIWYEPIGDWSDINKAPAFDLNWFDPPKPKRVLVLSNFGSTGEEQYVRAEKYIEKVPGAVSGNKGNKSTYVVACRLVKDFGLSESSAFTILRDVFNPKCQPPWSEAELMTFIKNASRYGKGGRRG